MPKINQGSMGASDNIHTDYSELEQLRKKTVQKVFLAMLPFCLQAGLVGVFLGYQVYKLSLGAFVNSDEDIDIIWAGVVGLGIVMTMIFVFFIKKRTRVYEQVFYTGDYAQAYAEKMIKPAIAFTTEKVNYNPTEGISKRDFQKSGFPLFSLPKHFYAPDSFHGEIGDVAFTFGQVKATQMVYNDRTPQELDLFKGLFMILDFHKQMDGHTIIYPDSFKYLSKLLLGGYSEEPEFISNSYKRVKLEDQIFEKLFEVYGTDQLESRYILSTALMARIVDFRLKSRREVQLSFKEGKVYIGIHYPARKRMFRPPLFQSVQHTKGLDDYLSNIKFMLELLNELNMNSKWII